MKTNKTKAKTNPMLEFAKQMVRRCQELERMVAKDQLEKFCKFLKDIDDAGNEHGYEGNYSLDTGPESWIEYFLDDCTGEEALLEDWSYA